MIVTTIDQFTAAIPTALTVENFDDVKTYVESAEIWIKTHVIGKDLYNAINDDASSVDNDTDLTRLVQNVICNHAMWDAAPFLDLQLTQQGFAVIMNSNSAPASKERVDRLRLQCITRRDQEIEYLIDYLEDNDTYHTLWKTSSAYTILSDCLIRTARELEQYANWKGSREEFLKLKPDIILYTVTKLNRVFSKDYIDELIEKQRDDDETTDDLVVLSMLKQSLGALLTGQKEAAGKVAADALRYIDENINSFATYAASREYAARNAERYANEAESTIFNSVW